MKCKRKSWMKAICYFLCLVLILSGLPIPAQAATKKVKLLQAEPQVFVPGLGESATITWNLENKQVVNGMIMDGEEVIAYLAKEEEYGGGYVPHKLSWDGRDKNGALVEGGTYRVVVEPQDPYQNYQSIAEVSVVAAPEENIRMLPNFDGTSFILYGAGGTKQGITEVELRIDGPSGTTTQKAEVFESIWFQKLPMSASIQSTGPRMI